MDHKEALRGMLQDVINDKMDQAAVTMHDYFVAKTRQVAGLAAEETVEEPAATPAADETVDEAAATE